jgi:anti-sigma factor RsiW
MNKCRRVTERLTPYVDGELPAGERGEVDTHLRDCPPCERLAASETGGRTVLREAAHRRQIESLAPVPLPPGLRSRCEMLAREYAERAAAGRAVSAASPWRLRAISVALAAVLMVFTASAFMSLTTHRDDGLLAAQLTSDHTRCFKRFGPASVADARQMEKMLSERYGWNIHIPPSSEAAGVQLVGAKRCFYSGGALPHILYRVNDQDVSLYVIDGVARPPADLVAAGHRSRVWSRDDKTYVFVSPAAAGDLTMAARYVMQDLRD